MTKKIILIMLLFLSLAFYLNRSYSMIYNRNLVPDLTSFWMRPITFTNPNFQNSVKYVSVGDSLTVGIGTIDGKKTLPYIIASKLSENMSVILVNVAVKGATVKDVAISQLPVAIAEKPNYVTVFIGTNDVHSLISVSSFEAKMDYILNFLTTQTSAKVIVFNLPYLGSERLILFPYNLFFEYQTKQYNQALFRVARKYNVSLIDFYTPTKNQFSRQPNFYSVDSFHPSGEGYIMWGSLLNPKDF
ncbi:MAG: SGNH/GDSL hydrolase family protein [Microgenomates group bacterium]|jgi:lysophospholipase L1-like esterase